jgi:insertion element IS1 protein InsB
MEVVCVIRLVCYISVQRQSWTHEKKEPVIQHVHNALLTQEPADAWHVVVQKIDTAERDEMWSFVRHKAQQRWLWHAIDHQSGTVLASVLGSHTDTVFLQLKQLLAPFGISRFYTDDWGTYHRHLNSEPQALGKDNPQKIARKHLTLRTRIKRLARKTLCFSKSVRMHDIVMGLFMNRYEFGLQI